MKSREIIIEQAPIEISPEKRQEIKNNIILMYNEFYTLDELIENIEMGYIFGKYGKSEHYSKDLIKELITEYETGIIPEPIPEPITEADILSKLINKGIIEQNEIDMAKEEIIVERVSTDTTTA